jgi:hypothetical protein
MGVMSLDWQCKVQKMSLDNRLPSSLIRGENNKLIICGADISLHSPALAVFDKNAQMYTIYFIGQRQRDLALHGCTLTLRDTCARIHMVNLRQDGNRSPGRFQRRPDQKAPITQAPDKEKLSDVVGRTNVTLLARALETHLPLREECHESSKSVHAPPPRGHVYIEGYAYGLFGRSASISSLCETTGTFKYLLSEMDVSYAIVSPSTIKKSFAGSGKATKKAITERFLAMTLNSPLHNIFSSGRKPTSPLTDVIDAFFVLQHHIG